MPHPPYSLDISTCDYHYFLSLQDFLVGRDTTTQAVPDNHIEQLISTRPKQFWKDGIRKSERIVGPVHNSSLAEILAAQKALKSLRNWRGYKPTRWLELLLQTRDELVLRALRILGTGTALTGSNEDDREVKREQVAAADLGVVREIVPGFGIAPDLETTTVHTFEVIALSYPADDVECGKSLKGKLF
ncbi:unnamed protein product [Heligmosomoides polygyrus]|uniref:Aldedh domain-containing protein n=1 Tax=Heligmosomoides polygyrus TaxID=6339 RepID=A0A183GF00_HELPZ|nr:unnamed protein product [Heligmosomoides polygyrus]